MTSVIDQATVRGQLGVAPVTLEAIRNPDIYQQEKEKIFLKHWLKVACTWEIEQPGDFKVKEIYVAGASIIVIRGKDDKIRAFHNVCTHRGNKVVPSTDHELLGSARGNVLTCRFHGWGFATDGSLRAVPLKELFGQLETKCLGLREIACDEWEGFVFVNFSKNPTTSLKDYLGEMGQIMSGYQYAESTRSFRYSAILKCNWKVALYAFSESYHVPTIHSGTLPGSLEYDHTDYKLTGPHASSAAYSIGMDVAPSTAMFSRILHSSDVHKPRPDQLPVKLNPTQRDDFQFELCNIFPNLIIHLGSGCGYPGLSYFTHQFWPMAHGETLWEGTNYFRPPQDAAEDLAQRHVSSLHRNAWLEDTATMEDTFSGIMSGVIDEMHLMDQEFQVRHAAQVIDAYLNG